MKFGGHETFHIREGWLHKGLRLLVESKDSYSDPYLADSLGVGRNMAKSIKFWLRRTGLAYASGQGKNSVMLPTPIAEIIWENDKYFLEPYTWWVLHTNLVQGDDPPAAWFWFYNHFNLTRFTKSVCVEGFTRFLQASNARMPSERTLERDISCLLSSYARDIPPRNDDPEDAYLSPFVSLGILTHYRGSGYYEVDKSQKDIPSAALLYALSSSLYKWHNSEHSSECLLTDAARKTNSPGRTMMLTSETLYEALHNAESELNSEILTTRRLAGERQIYIKPDSPAFYLAKGYEILSTKRESHVA